MTEFPDSTDALDWAQAFMDEFDMPDEPADVHEWFAAALAAGIELGHIQAGLDHNVEQGFIEVVGTNDAGQPTYRMTEAGKARVENMMAGGN